MAEELSGWEATLGIIRPQRSFEQIVELITDRIDPELTAPMANGDVVREAARLHEETVSTLCSYTDDQLHNTVRFSGRTRTMMELLWAWYAYRAYHIGNIDLRQSNTRAPNFFHTLLRAA